MINMWKANGIEEPKCAAFMYLDEESITSVFFVFLHLFEQSLKRTFVSKHKLFRMLLPISDHRHRKLNTKTFDDN